MEPIKEIGEDTMNWMIFEDVMKNGVYQNALSKVLEPESSEPPWPDDKEEEEIACGQVVTWTNWYEKNVETEKEQLVPTHRQSEEFCLHENTYDDNKDGAEVCCDCGKVFIQNIIYTRSLKDPYIMFYGIGNGRSTYKRSHYCNDLINQWTCRDTSITRPDLEIIKTFLPISGLVNKKTIRFALRQMGRAKDGEDWIYVQCKLTGMDTPAPDGDILRYMKDMFQLIEVGFEKCKPANRKCMVHYNYIFVRILQILDKPEYFKYFPLLKSKTKVKAIDDVWRKICDCLGLTYLPLPTPKMFKLVGNCHGPSATNGTTTTTQGKSAALVIRNKGIKKCHFTRVYKPRRGRRTCEIVELPDNDFNEQENEEP